MIWYLRFFVISVALSYTNPSWSDECIDGFSWLLAQEGVVTVFRRVGVRSLSSWAVSSRLNYSTFQLLASHELPTLFHFFMFRHPDVLLMVKSEDQHLGLVWW